MERKLAEPTFTDVLMLDYGSPKMAKFFAEMDAVVPWADLAARRSPTCSTTTTTTTTTTTIRRHRAVAGWPATFDFALTLAACNVHRARDLLLAPTAPCRPRDVRAAATATTAASTTTDLGSARERK